MKFEVDVNLRFDQREAPRWDEILLEMVSRVLANQENTIMPTLEELNTVLGTISTDLDKVSADTDNLLAQLAAIPPGGLTPEQQAAIDLAVTSATAISTRLKALDAKVPDVTA